MENPERGIPVFDGTPSKWKEYERRANFFIAKLTIDKKQEQAGLLITTGLTGTDWDVVKDMKPDDLASTGAAQGIMALLKARFEKNIINELSDDFEAFFGKMHRKNTETLFEYVQRFIMLEKKLEDHAVKLPKLVSGWLLLNRGGFSKEEKHLVRTQIGKNLEFNKVKEALDVIFGQEHKLNKRYQKESHAAYADDEDWFDSYDDFEA